MARENRRLAVIVAADIAGYSHLIGKDEEETLRALRAHRREFIDPLIEEHYGRIANTAGDSLLLEFPSTVEAVRCAVGLQEGMNRRNSDIETDRRIRFRIGINIGDVIAEGDDLLGDGVNVAARLENIADPGGIFVSSGVHEQVEGRVDQVFDDLGHRKLKNISRLVHVFQVHMADTPRHEYGGGAFTRPAVPNTVAARGRCMCGAVQFEMDQPPFDTITCHCRMCQRFNSALFSVWAVFPEEAVRFTRGKPVEYISSAIGVRGFCDKCGSSLTMTYYAPDRPGILAFLTPCLDNPEDFPPTRHAGVESQMPWLDLNDSLPRTRSWEEQDQRDRWAAVGLPDPDDWK